MTTRRTITAFLLPLLLLGLPLLVAAVAAAPPAAAQDAAPPHRFLHNSNPADPLFDCTQYTVGQMACQAGVRCKCLYEAFGNAMLGLPPRSYRWDCNPSHGGCLADVPAETSGHYGASRPPIVPPTPWVTPQR